MLFTQPIYIIFFALVFVTYWSLKSLTLRKWLLLIASLIFYGWWNWGFLFLIGFIIMTTWGAAQYMGRTDDNRKRYWAAALSIIAALFVLGVFKYFNFFLDSLNYSLYLAGAPELSTTWKILLPVGISFYTFQAISYTVDVYKNKMTPNVPLLDYATYVAFFPQLVAGPIVRPQTFLPQIASMRTFHFDMVRPYIFMFMLGYFKKAVVADNIAAVIDPVFATPGLYDSPALYLAAFLYSVQIYCDFSGYTDMAIASAGLLGFRLRLNFFFPYFARTIQDFWRRWHISLSSWLRDYLYIAMGGNRGGKWKMYRNIMLTMLLGGLWHGAGWNFIIWGFFHGLGQVAIRFYKLPRFKPIPEFVYTGISIAGTFVFVTFLWIFFRAQTFAHSREFIQGLVFWRSGDMLILGPMLWGVVITATLFHAFNAWKHPAKWLGRIPTPVFYLGVGLFAALCLALTAPGYAPFIYFQF